MTHRKPQPPLHLRAVRAALRRLNARLSRHYDVVSSRRNPLPQPAGTLDIAAAREVLTGLELADTDAEAYFAKHRERLARTLSLVPAPRKTKRALELGCYMQLTPFLRTHCGYQEVCGAAYGRLGRREFRIARTRNAMVDIEVQLFDAERDPFPYGDSSFDLVLACELIEHLLRDPMHMLTEVRRILIDGGRLLLTTPNVASLTSVARVLNGHDNPQIYSKYSRPMPDSPDHPPHVREYTALELRRAVESAGFEVEALMTEGVADCAVNSPMWNFLEEQGFDTSLRGEQTYLIGVKRSNLPVVRYPQFLYSQ